MNARPEHDGISQMAYAVINLLTTLKGSLLEPFFPAAWDLGSTWMPTQPGVLFFIRALVGPLEAEAN